jgi:ATP-dependent Clp protease ATP-binding subunit ClpC
LVAQLGHGQFKRAKARSTDGAAIARMQSEHHRISSLTTALDAAFADVCGVEELAVEALFRGDRVDSYLPEAAGARQRFRAALVRALVAEEPHRDEATLILQELGGGRALDLWLAPLLRALPSRQWQATLHVHGDGGGAEGWPEGRKWGPPRSAEWALAELARPDRSPYAWMLCLRGPLAGILISLEAGLHRIALSLRPDDPPAHLVVTLLARKVAFSDAEWMAPAFEPPPLPSLQEVKPGLLVRDYDGREELLTLFSRRGAVPLAHADYWPQFDAIALEHLLVFEAAGAADRDTALAPRFKGGWEELRALLRRGRTIDAIKLYRERTGAGLRDAKEAVEAMAAEREEP